MTLYFPQIVFKVADEDESVCDYVMQGFENEADAKILYPEAEIKVVEITEWKPQDN